MNDWLDKCGLRDTSNRFWPLPPNYDELSVTDQQVARLNVLRNWNSAEEFVVAWYFLRTLYLARTKHAVFYKRGIQESPDFHYQMVYDLASHGRNANAAPRGFAKCLSGESQVPTRRGSLVALKDIEVGEEVQALDGRGRIKWSQVVAKTHSGKKNCLRVRTQQGHEFKCTSEHRVFANNKWVEAGNLRIGDLVATPRTALPTSADGDLTPKDAELLGILVGDGCTMQCCRLTNFDADIVAFVGRAIAKHPGWVLREIRGRAGHWIISARWKKNNPTQWLRQHGLYGKTAKTKRIPKAVWESSDSSLAAFLRGMFDTDGTVNPKTNSIAITLANEPLIRDIQLALLRLGIRSRYTYRKASYNQEKQFDSWHLHISSAEARHEFAKRIGFRVKAKQHRLEATLGIGGHDAIDVVPFPREERKRRLKPSMWRLRKWYNLRVDNHYNITRPKLLRLGHITDDQGLMDRATSDIYWDQIVSVEPCGLHDTYDIQVEKNANFLCEGVFVHNSTVLIECILLLVLSRPGYEIILAQSTDKAVEERFAQIRTQLEQNELILQDFGVLQPPRGKGLWSNHYLSLLNGSVIKGLSVMGKKRGGRPALFILDDPENDPDSDTEASRAALTAKFETILFKQIIPMLEEGSCAFWIGTLIDRKSFLYKALNSDDPRFNFWNRKIYRARYEDEDTGARFLLWPAKWSWRMLDAREEEIGVSAFASEYLNNPVSPQDRILSVDPRKNEYEVEGEFNWNNPLGNQNIVKWQERLFERDDGGTRYFEECEAKFNDHVLPMFRFLLFDYAYSLKGTADYSCIAVCGMDTLSTMWVLDMWLGRGPKDTLLRLIYEYGLKWRVRIVGIETAGVQKDFMDAYQEYSRERNEAHNDQWIGRCFPVTYPAKESKAQRIASLEWRFQSGRIKYPAHMKHLWPWVQLYAQTHDFTLDLALLPTDDAIDVLSMSKYVVKNRGQKLRRERGKSTLVERIIKNTPEVKGMPLLSGVSSAEITDEMMNILSERARRNTGPNLRRKRERPRRFEGGRRQ